MKKLFKTLALTLALVLPFAAMAQEETAKTTINVGGDAGSPNISWTVTAEEESDGIFVITFDGAIKEGYHGYAMADFSAPVFDFTGVEIIGDVIEPLTPENHGIDETTKMPSLIYEHQAIYIHKIKAKAGQKINAYVNATICTNETNQCTANTVDFYITMPEKATVAKKAETTETVEEPEVAAETEVAEKVEKDWRFVAERTRTTKVDAVKKDTVDITLFTLQLSRELGDEDPAIYNDAKFDFGKYNNLITMGAPVVDELSIKFTSEPFEIKEGTKINGSVTISEAQYNLSVSAGKADKTEETIDWSNLLMYIGQAIAWGFLALVTPCVFPMVPMTVSFFVKGSQTPAQGRFRALMYGFFIVALYVLPIALLVLLSNAFGTNAAGDAFNFISTHWIPNLIFFAIFMVFAASFFGAFEITMPSKLVNKSDAGADKGGIVGIFFMALTLVLVSFSCTGPIVGTVIITSTQGGNIWAPIIVMAAFAIAFALPFTVLAWFPSLLKNMPKSGGWLNSVKVVLGFIEVALGLKFLMTADQTMGWGILDREVYLAIWIVTFSLLGLYLLGKLRFAHDDETHHVSVFRLTLAIAVFSFVVYMIPGMWGAPLKAISGYIPPLTTQDYLVDGTPKDVNADRKYADFLHLPHNLPGHFDLDEAIAEATEKNKPIFIDVTGHACNNCREMENYVWSDPKVKKMLEEDFIICALYVDDKRKVNEKGEIDNENGFRLGTANAKLAEERWKVNAQPAYLLLTPDGEEVIAGPRGYDRSVDGFVEFLESGKSGKVDNITEGKVTQVK